ncbi:MAG TPA: 3'-5' exonuclease [Herpetosiphonaceae bacterium]
MTDELPIFPYWDQKPNHLKTETQLKREGFKPGGPVRALIRYKAGGTIRRYALYDQAEARPKSPPTAAQRAALAAAQRARRTCRSCGTEVARPGLLDEQRRCAACLAAQRRQRRAEVRDGVIRWARALMQRDDWLVLDTETTDLADHGGVLVEIGVLAPDGSVVFTSLVNPLAEIAPEAQAVHGLTLDQLADAPTFAALEPQLRTLLVGKTIVAYHTAFERGIFLNELRRLDRPHVDSWDDTLRQALTWADAITWQCAMEPYARFVGEPYAGGYRYQRLPGAGHRAVGDAQATVAFIRRLAETPFYEEGGGE